MNTTINNQYVLRNTTIIEWENSDIAIIKPEQLVIELTEGFTKGRIIDIGALCYARRGVQKTHEKSRRIDPNSLRQDRCSTIKKIGEFLLSQNSPTTADTYFRGILPFFNWMDSKKENVDFSDENQMVELYGDYTAQLLEKMRPSSIKGRSLEQSSASVLQKGAVDVVTLSTSLHPLTVYGSAVRFKQRTKNPPPTLPPDPEDHKQAVRLNLAIFYAISDYLMDDKILPIVIKENPFDPVIFYSRMAPRSKVILLAQEETFLDWESVSYKAEKLGIKLTPKDYKAHHFHKTKIRKRKGLNQINLYLANLAICAFSYAFFGVTGTNMQVLFELNLNKATTTSNRGMRFSGFKGRGAGGKDVYPEFGVRFLPHFKHYLAFREWFLKKYSVQSKLPFFSIDTNLSQDKSGIVSPLSQRRLSAYKDVFCSWFPNAKWVTATALRKGLSNYYLTETKDPVIPAEKLGHSPATTLKYYSKATFKQASQELTAFFSAVRDRVNRETRKHDGVIPTRILNNGSLGTPAAHCDASGAEPSLAEGFTEKAPQPRCGQPESCLFCEHFVVHTDDEDVRKLLSLKDVLMKIKPKAKNFEHFEQIFVPVLYRIDEVLDQMQKQKPAMKSLIQRIKEEVANGQLDHFWGNHFDFLVEAGYIS